MQGPRLRLNPQIPRGPAARCGPSAAFNLTHMSRGRNAYQASHCYSVADYMVGSERRRNGRHGRTHSAGSNPILKLARPAGFEPATSSLEGSCSIQLSYGRVARN